MSFSSSTPSGSPVWGSRRIRPPSGIGGPASIADSLQRRAVQGGEVARDMPDGDRVLGRGAIQVGSGGMTCFSASSVSS